MIRVREQREVELVFALELDVTGNVVGTDAEDFSPELFELLRAVAECTGFARAARRVVARIEVKDDRAALEIGQLHFAAVVSGQRERGGFVTFFQPAGGTILDFRFWILDLFGHGHLREAGPAWSLVISRWRSDALLLTDIVAPAAERCWEIRVCSANRDNAASRGRSRRVA